MNFRLPSKMASASLSSVRECADSYHVATLDNDAEAIFEGSLEFIEDHSG